MSDTNASNLIVRCKLCEREFAVSNAYARSKAKYCPECREVVDEARKRRAKSRHNAGRERDTETLRAVEHATRHAEAVARDNCRDCVHNPNGHNFEGGNAAAMRKALAELVANIEMRLSAFGIFSIIDRKTFLDARAALSKPPRNCDLPNPEELYSEFCSRYQSCSCCPHNKTLSELRCDGKWLLAPVAERKGEGDAI